MSTALFRKADLFNAPSPKAGRAHMVVAVDGPAASGKGTLARKLAERLGYAWMDTGALYRAVGLTVLESGGSPDSVEDALRGVEVMKRNLTPELLANPALRTAEVGQAASQVAAIPAVRAALLDLQRNFAATPMPGMGGVVLDGRDIGTVVCPDADVKIFVTASVEERARRRFSELQAAGGSLSYDEVLADLKARDARDSNRAVAPTRAHPDAYVIDTTGLGVSETLEQAIDLLRARFLEDSGKK